MPAAPIILPPGDGDAYWVLDSLSTIKLNAEQTGGKFDLCETLAPPDTGPPPHTHAHNDEMFYILEGQFGLVFGEQSLVAKTGDAFYLPKNIPHTYKNIGNKPGRFLVWSVPSGFADFVKAMESPATDINSPPPVNEATIGKLMSTVGRFGIEMLMEHKPTRQGPPFPAPAPFWLLGQHVALHLDAKDTAGNFSVATITMPPSGRMPSLVHHQAARMLYVLDGAVIFGLEGLQLTAAPGTFLHIPPGVVHWLHNPGRAAAKVLDVHTPAGYESFIREAGAPVTEQTKTAPAYDEKALAAIAAKYEMEIKLA
jgi:quercetin dioxygenase-like cupin family protein